MVDSCLRRPSAANKKIRVERYKPRRNRCRRKGARPISQQFSTSECLQQQVFSDDANEAMPTIRPLIVIRITRAHEVTSLHVTWDRICLHSMFWFDAADKVLLWRRVDFSTAIYHFIFGWAITLVYTIDIARKRSFKQVV